MSRTISTQALNSGAKSFNQSVISLSDISDFATGLQKIQSRQKMAQVFGEFARSANCIIIIFCEGKLLLEEMYLGL